MRARALVCLVTDQRGGAVSQYGFLQPEGREGIAVAHSGGHVRRAAAARSHLHAPVAPWILSDQSLLR